MVFNVLMYYDRKLFLEFDFMFETSQRAARCPPAGRQSSGPKLFSEQHLGHPVDFVDDHGDDVMMIMMMMTIEWLPVQGRSEHSGRTTSLEQHCFSGTVPRVRSAKNLIYVLMLCMWRKITNIR